MAALRPLPPSPVSGGFGKIAVPAMRVAFVDGLARVGGFVLAERLIEVLIAVTPRCYQVGLDRTGGAELFYVRFAGCEAGARRDEAFVVELAEQCRSGVLQLGADGQAGLCRGLLDLAPR